MKQLLFVFTLLVGTFFFVPTFPSFASSPTESMPVDKNVQVTANIRQAKYLMDNREDYAGALKLLKKALNLSPSNSEALKLQEVCNNKIAEQLKAEKNAYNRACKVGTKTALQGFISRYPNSTYKKDAENRMADFELWTQALNANTIDAYNNYLKTSKYLSFKNEASEKISAIEAEIQWNKYKDTNDYAVMDDYISKYPDSPHIEEAKWKRLVLIGEKYYSMNKPYMAYQFLNDANNQKTLTGNTWIHFQKLKKDREYEEMLNSPSISKVKSYLSSLDSKSEYYVPISNHLAILIARELNRFSSDDKMDEARSYAKDASTKASVNSYIHSAKEARSQYNRMMRAYAHKHWWKENFSWGFDIDYETNLANESGSDMYYSVGVVSRFGSYKHKFNMTIGVKYRWFRVMPPIDVDDAVEWELYGGTLAIPVNLRFNIARISTRSRFFIGVGGEYGAKTFEKMRGAFENSYVSIFPKIGLTSPHFDMSMYWKTYIGGPFVEEARNDFDEYKSSSLLGFQMAVFF